MKDSPSSLWRKEEKGLHGEIFQLFVDRIFLYMISIGTEMKGQHRSIIFNMKGTVIATTVTKFILRRTAKSLHILMATSAFIK